VTAGRARWRRGGLAIALLVAMGSPALAQIQQNPNLPPRPDDRPPAPLTTDDGQQFWNIDQYASAHRTDKYSPWEITDRRCDSDHPVLSPAKTTRECRIDPESGEPYWYETTYQDYHCAKAPLRRRFISGFEKLGRCRRVDYGTSYAQAQSGYDEQWPVPPEQIDDPEPGPPASGDSGSVQTGEGPIACLGKSDRYRYVLIGGECERDGLDRVHQHNDGGGHHNGK
jgi:hypothetical protein